MKVIKDFEKRGLIREVNGNKNKADVFRSIIERGNIFLAPI